MSVRGSTSREESICSGDMYLGVPTSESSFVIAVSSGKIRVRTERDGEDVVIAIADTGAGIPEDIRDRVFDLFFTTKAVGEGSGQGLALARATVVDKHGGTLTFESVVGRGTTFFVRLPIAGRT